jgi:catechol 2,3-dioxygenase-like lactoylglutathione lyase family enzyme
MLCESNVNTVFLAAKDLRRARHFYEAALGFVPVSASSESVTYNAGGVNLRVGEVSGFGSNRNPGGDDSELLVFHVHSVDEMRARLESRGVSFSPTLRYEIGATTSFHDPDQHNITLYEPSDESLLWLSGPKVKALMEAPPPDGTLLGSRNVLYLFLFVRDTAEALRFYRDVLGLRVIEDDPDAGVVKYDCGGLIIATHLVGGDSRCAVDMDLAFEKGIAPAFSVGDMRQVLTDLKTVKVDFLEMAAASSPWATAKFRDPSGHQFYLTDAARVIDRQRGRMQPA